MKQLALFKNWLRDQGFCSELEQLVTAPIFLSELLRLYGIYMFDSGKSRYYFALVVTCIARVHRQTKLHLHACWDLLTAWQWLFPVQHRPPLPISLYKSLIVLALMFGWFRWAGVLMTGFRGIARIGEPLKAKRNALILPVDMLDMSQHFFLLRINDPKTKRRGARVQHTKIDSQLELHYVSALCFPLLPDEQLYPGTPNMFRRRWDFLLSRLDIPHSKGFIPSGVRGGGCVHAYQSGLSITDLMWKMRIRHTDTLQHYLQEASALVSLADLNPKAKTQILSLQTQFDFWVQLATEQLLAHDLRPLRRLFCA